MRSIPLKQVGDRMIRRPMFILALCTLSACTGTTLNPSPVTGPSSWAVTTGGSAQSEALQTADYYPNSITINEGDTVTWTDPAAEPHTVSIPPAGQAPPPGPPQPPVGGKTFDGTAYISSGFLAKGATYAVTFTKAGIYKVYCLIHQPEMVLTVVVQVAGAPLPMTQAQYTAAGQADFTIDINAAAAAVLAFPYPVNGNTLAAGIQPGATSTPPTQSSVVRFLHGPTLDGTVTVPVGTKLTWNNISQFLHTVTFPIVGQVPSEPPPGAPAGGATYDGTVYTSSGLIPPGGSYQLTFTKAGTYIYYCLYHGAGEGMVGTVIVQ